MEHVVLYLVIGVVWSIYLESITENIEGAKKWTDLERFFQTTGWPVFLVIFIVTLIKES